MTKINMRTASLRKKSGMTQQEMADLLQVSPQSVSKWETGVSLPDITLLPGLAEILGVTVDQLLGLQPLPEEQYVPERTGDGTFWDQKLDYLLRTRKRYYNREFVQYLIRDVWKIERPVEILDCGCGYGFLGLLLLPLLPRGSTYTGIDCAGELIRFGGEEFQRRSLKADFVEQDFLQYSTEKKFDIVIAQAVLRHVDDAERFLEKMISHAKEGGLVISIEANRELECDGLYIEEMDYFELCERSGLKKKWKQEYDRQGRDYAVAMRVPGMMCDLGLRDVDVRMNDKVEFVSEAQEDYERIKSDFVKYNDWNAGLEGEERENRIRHFISRGMTRKEAEDYCARNVRIQRALEREGSRYLFFKGHMIAFGRKKG